MTPLNHIPPEYLHSVAYHPINDSKRKQKMIKIVGILVLCSPLLIYLAVALNGLRPVYHNLRANNMQLSRRQGDLVIARERGLWRLGPSILVNADTGREIPLTRVPWRNYSPTSIVAYNRVFVINERNGQLALIDPFTREKIVPFGVYRTTWLTQGDLTQVIADRYWGIINHQTGEVVLPADYFNQLAFLSGTTRFIGVTQHEPWPTNFYWGVFCLYTQQLVAPMIHDDNSVSYRQGMIVARIGNYGLLLCPYTQQELIPYGKFHNIFPINHTFVDVRRRYYGAALMNIATNEIIAPFGMFSRFEWLNDDEMRVWQGDNRGTLNLHTMDVVWDN